MLQLHRSFCKSHCCVCFSALLGPVIQGKCMQTQFPGPLLPSSCLTLSEPSMKIDLWRAKHLLCLYFSLVWLYLSLTGTSCHFFLVWWILLSLPFLSFNLLTLQGLTDMLRLFSVQLKISLQADISKSDIKLTLTEPADPCWDKQSRIGFPDLISLCQL